MERLDPADRARAEAALRWIRKPDGEGAGGVLNLCYNAVDRQVVAGRADEIALVAASGAGQRSWSYAALLEDVAALAGALRLLGAAPQSTVPVLLPSGPDSVLAVLACLRLGAVPLMLPEGVEAARLAALIDEKAPPVMLTAAGTAWREALEEASVQVGSVVVRQPAGGTDGADEQTTEEPAELTEPRDLEWDFVARAGRSDPAPCARVGAEDPAYAVLADGPILTVSAGGLALAATGAGGGGRSSGRHLGWAVDVLGPMIAGLTVHLDAGARP